MPVGVNFDVINWTKIRQVFFYPVMQGCILK